VVPLQPGVLNGPHILNRIQIRRVSSPSVHEQNTHLQNFHWTFRPKRNIHWMFSNLRSFLPRDIPTPYATSWDFMTVSRWTYCHLWHHIHPMLSNLWHIVHFDIFSAAPSSYSDILSLCEKLPVFFLQSLSHDILSRCLISSLC
jgi:hypothetical protein